METTIKKEAWSFHNKINHLLKKYFPNNEFTCNKGGDSNGFSFIKIEVSIFIANMKESDFVKDANGIYRNAEGEPCHPEKFQGKNLFTSHICNTSLTLFWLGNKEGKRCELKIKDMEKLKNEHLNEEWYVVKNFHNLVFPLPHDKIGKILKEIVTEILKIKS